MARERLRIIYAEEGGKPISYQYLNYSESIRAMKILEAMYSIKGWIPASQLSIMIQSPRHSTTRTLNKLIGAKKIEPNKYNTLLLIKNRPKNPKANITRQRYLKPTTYICAHQGGTHK